MTNSRHTNDGQPPVPELPADPVDERLGNSPFPIVGLGASAGGLEALTQLLSALPAESGMAFLVVQHLDPRHSSRLPELLARATSMPVVEGSHGLKVESNHVYVIPPNASMALAQGLLHLTPRGEGRGLHLPIDYLFRSLAADQVGRAIAVVLSGTGSDGTQGVCEIKAVGGITFAQEERTAGHSGMPRSAIDSGCVDFVLPPDGIAKRLTEIGGHPYLRPVPALVEPEPTAESSYHRILAAVRGRTGVDFSLYRDTTIRRRIMRRMALHAVASIADYAERLKSDKVEVDALYNDLLINVTSFFRDSEMFEALKSNIFPELAKAKAPADPFRIWVPGCSTGQEAYSLAIALVEFYDNQPVRPPIQVFATDLSDQTALDKARAGVYPEGIEIEVSADRLRRFFRREDHVYRIEKSIRDMCVFARHNVTADPPFSHLDLISCRNVLIYLATPLQKRILPTFHYALNVPGFLVLGSAETVGENADLFEVVDRAHRIYAKKGGAVRQHVFFPAPDMPAGAPFVARRPAFTGPAAHDFQREADRILLGRYAPPGVLVDDNLDILQFRGRTSPFLESPPGDPTTSVLKMAREGLFLELRNALDEARKHQRTARRDGFRIRNQAGVQEIAIEVVPVTLTGGAACYLILFQEPAGAESIAADVPELAPATSDLELARELVQLRQELAATREYLQSMIEQQDAANEELRSANEEILSSNEELQSTNEELETAKEELQSANEELTTVNEQLQRRNQELDLANNDLLNLLSSTDIAVVMVGADRRIRRFTPPARKVLSLLPTDVGRPIGDLKPAVNVPDLEQIIDDVIDRVQPVGREVRDRDGRWYMLRGYPYRTGHNSIEGAVLVLVDIDQIHRDKENLDRQATLLGLSQDAIVIRDAEDRITFWNRGAEEMYGFTADEARGQRIEHLLHTDRATWASLSERLDQDKTWDGELVQTRKDGTAILVHCREVLVRNENGKRASVLAIKRDITERHRAMEALKEADHRKDEFLATLAHELRNPLAPIRNAVEIMRLAGNDREAIERSREVMDRQAGQLARIVEDLIDLARIVEKKIELRKERVRVNTVVETAVESCRPAIERSHQRLTVTLPEEDLYVDADPVRISQVLVNLLNNASKYTDAGGEITLTAERSAVEPAESDAGGDGASERDDGKDSRHPRQSKKKSSATGKEALVVRIRDTGSGIAPALIPHVFEMFTQGPRNTQQGRGGLGVGLALVRSLVEMHGGSVEAHSEGPQKGSEFVIRLPLTAAPEVPSRSTASSPAGGPAKRILVVDDNDDQVQSLAMLLSLMGHTVAQASNGAEAIERAGEFQPDVMLVDIGMPGMQGYEVARRIREEPRLRKVVLVAQTGWGGEEDRRRSKEAGFDGHLVKPLTLATLDEVLRAAPK
jgi:two-component system CheB/CheR fusion protein